MPGHLVSRPGETDQSCAARHLGDADPTMRKIIALVGPCRLRSQARRSPYEALVQSVVYQQLNGAAAATIFARLKGLFPSKRFFSPEDLLAMPEERLRMAGLSRAKVASVRDIASKTLSGLVPTRRQINALSDQEILARLTQLRGVGPWTVEMLLIFTLGRPDVLPVTDYGVRKGFALAYGRKALPEPKELTQFGERWSPCRSTAAWYLWRVLDVDQGFPPANTDW